MQHAFQTFSYKIYKKIFKLYFCDTQVTMCLTHKGVESI